MSATLLTGATFEQNFIISNTGGSVMDYAIDFLPAGDWLKGYSYGDLSPGQTDTISVTMDAGEKATGTYSGKIQLWWHGDLQTEIPATMTVIGAADILTSKKSVAFGDEYVGNSYDSIIQIKNNGVLPLQDVRRVAVIGQLAIDARTQGGGSATVMPEYTVSPLDGLRAALGPDVTVTHSVGVRLQESLRPIPVDDIDVDWLDENGTVLRHELRHSGQLIWLGDAVREASEVRLSCRFRADAAGTWRFGYVGLGRFTLALNGQTLLDETLAGEPHKPGEAALEVGLADGDELDVVLTHFPAPNSPVVGLMLGAQRPHQPANVEKLEAMLEATAADVAIVVVGTTEAVESEGFDRTSLALPDGQDELVRAIAQANPRTVVVVNSGGPVLLPWRDEVAAVLLTWFGGQEMGAALADVLLGIREPGGRLPTTWLDSEAAALTTIPTDGVLEYTEGLHVGYRRDQPYAYPFGHGLGYTTWEYLDIEAATVDSVSVRLRNTGSRAGKTVVQAYLSRQDSALDRPARWLAGFAVVTADPGAEVTARVQLPARAWQHWSVDEHAWATESGVFTVSVGSSVADLPRSAEISVA